MLMGVSQLRAQKVHLVFDEMPLNQVFIELRDSFDIQFSFNDELLSSCIVTTDREFQSLELAIAALAENCGLVCRKRGNVYLVLKNKEKRYSSNFILQGSVVDRLTKFPLPFSAVQIDRSGVVSDGNGNFTFVSSDSILTIQVSHVGYYRADTVLNCSGNQQIELSPQSVGLSEVVVSADKETAKALSPVIENPGMVKLNRQMASFLPGSSDNTINNLLRLQPGILAAGEQTNEFTIWGSYKGQSHVIFDGITLFNFTSVNDNVGAVNPLMISDIEVIKAGYNVHVGDRAGGVVHITSTDARKDRVHGEVRISDQSTAARLSIPFSKKISVQAAGRLVFPQNLGSLIHEGLKGTTGKRIFADGNFKVSGSFGDQDNFQISVIGGREQDFQNGTDLTGSAGSRASREMDNYQVGVSGAYSMRWKRAGNSRALISYSTFSTSRSTLFEEVGSGPDSLKTGLEFAKNGISEIKAQLEHQFPSTKVQTASVSVGFIQNRSAIAFDSTTVSLPATTKDVSRPFVYIKDDIRIGRMITLQPGVRLDVRLENPRVFIQPRFGLLLKPDDHWRVKLAWGLYNQFISENTLIGPFGNELYFWQVADGTANFVQSSMHNMAGVSFSKWGFNAAVEGYFKTLNGLVRWTYDPNNELPFFHANGNGRSYGFDVTLKKKIWKLDLSVAYSWSKTQDAFNSIDGGNFQRAPHDQRQEAKASAIIDLHPFFVSLSYVHGSGFPIQMEDGTFKDRPYNRFDVALLFQKKLRHAMLETGISVLNVTNYKNVRYNSFTSFPDASRIYRSGMRITPLVFFNVRF